MVCIKASRELKCVYPSVYGVREYFDSRDDAALGTQSAVGGLRWILSDGIFNDAYQFLRIKGFFNKGHGIFDGMVTVNAADHDNRRIL
jgi:hypothetical protein